MRLLLRLRREHRRALSPQGRQVLEYDRGSKAFRDAVALSKYAASEDKGTHWGEAEKGRLLIQDHHDSTVSYCNLKVKEL